MPSVTGEAARWKQFRIRRLLEPGERVEEVDSVTSAASLQRVDLAVTNRALIVMPMHSLDATRIPYSHMTDVKVEIEFETGDLSLWIETLTPNRIVYKLKRGSRGDLAVFVRGMAEIAPRN